MKILISIIVIALVSFLFWIVGGLNLDYLRANGITKAVEVCDKGSKVVYEGYQRSILNGFGGKVWYMCNINNNPYSFPITQRINNRELQVYEPTPIQQIPSSFNIE